MSDSSYDYTPQPQKPCGGTTTAEQSENDNTPIEPADPIETNDLPPRRETPVAPPSFDVSRLPAPLVIDDDGEQRPMTISEASETWIRVQRWAWNTDDRTSRYERDLQHYAGILEADRRLQREYGDGLTTVLLSRRLSPIEDGDWLPPVSLGERLHTADSSVSSALRYHLRGFDWEYVRVTAMTTSAATPHLHRYIWIDDPQNEIERRHFQPAIEKHVEQTPGAAWKHHRGDTISIRHDPPRVDFKPERPAAVSEIDVDEFSHDGWLDISELSAAVDDVAQNTVGAYYVARQLPNLVLRDVFDGSVDVEQTRLDGAAASWAITHDRTSSSQGIEI